MYIGISKKLKSMGGLRIGFGKRYKGISGLIALFFVGIFYLYYYLFLGSCWLLYGICYVFFYLPIKAVIKAIKSYKSKNSDI